MLCRFLRHVLLLLLRRADVSLIHKVFYLFALCHGYASLRLLLFLQMLGERLRSGCSRDAEY